MPPTKRLKPVSKDAKRFLDADKDDTRLIGSIRQHLLKKPVGEGRAQNVIHPSEMAKSNWCHRATAHRILGHKSAKPFKPSYQLINVFEEGHLIHAKWQRWLTEMGVLFGNWKCEACEAKFTALAPRQCPYCMRADLLTYKEVPVCDEERNIYGHADGVVQDNKGETLIEIKSIGLGTIRFEAPELLTSPTGEKHDIEQVWASIRRPLASHVRQATIYSTILGLSHITFLYEFKPTQAVKEFYVRSQPSVVAPLLDACESIVEHTESGNLPPCNLGDSCSECEQYE